MLIPKDYTFRKLSEPKLFSTQSTWSTTELGSGYWSQLQEPTKKSSRTYVLTHHVLTALTTQSYDDTTGLILIQITHHNNITHIQFSFFSIAQASIERQTLLGAIRFYCILFANSFYLHEIFDPPHS